MRSAILKHPALVALPKRVRDRDVFHDKHGRVYVALGYIQPENRVLSFLKYAPDKTGLWQSNGIRYGRIFWGGTNEATKGMKAALSNYLIDDPHFGTTLLEVPREDITKYYSPELRLKEIIEEGPQDPLESSTKGMAEILHDTLEIPYEQLGIAGSIVWKAHNPIYSDINMCIYGFDYAWKLNRSYDELEENKHIRLKQVSEWTELINRIVERVDGFSFEDMHLLFTRRKELCYKDRCIGIMPILLPEETPIPYGSESYELVVPKPVRLTLEIVDIEYSIFLPALYGVDSDPLDILNGECISRIMVYEGSFRGLIKEGDKVEVMGSLQKVVLNGNSSEFYQVMVGTKKGARQEYIRVIE
jgi:predicted nucleotidyltransferase